MALSVKGLERRKKDNPCNYTEEQLDKKKLALIDMKKLYPDVPDFYAELVYDMIANKTEEEIEELKHRVDNTPPKYDGQGGTSYTLEILDP
jgi:hypothetical protein